MGVDPSTVGGSADLGKGLFGYRRSDVQQLLADRDVLLVEAERRMRASKARIDELESALAETGQRNVRVEEHLLRLQAQVETLSARNAEVERLAGRVRAEGERVTAWRKRMQMVATTMPPAFERFGLLLDDVPNRIQEALTPVAVNAPALLARMEACAEMIRRAESQIDLEFGELSR
jgi:chromosome segregation ATPase